ncbi:MAG: hypothetical protein E3J21_24150 [Anaerolineales bacterium]|nr:MAG: hypothetical protein E3J21_24150 [Anaerolineales bacterium]
MPYILVVEEGRSRLVKEKKYKAEKGEATLQDLVEKYPHLLPLPGVEAGDLVILTVQREYRATDLLCVDSDGGVIIVECKLRENQTMREVVAQLLDYTSTLWKVTYAEFNEHIKSYLEGDIAEKMLKRRREEGLLEDEDEEEWKEDFRNKLINNLQTGAFRLVVVADRIPEDIRNVVEYLSSLYSVEIYCVEVGYFPDKKGEKLEITVPHLIEFGKRSASAPSAQPRSWDRESFLEICQQRGGTKRRESIENLITFGEELEREGTGICTYGRSVSGSFIFRNIDERMVFTLYSNGSVHMHFHRVLGADDVVLEEYMDKLNALPIFRYAPQKDIDHSRGSKKKVEALAPEEIEQFKEIVRWFLPKTTTQT